MSSCLSYALKRSCHHQIHKCFRMQIARLERSGYPDSLLGGVAESPSKKTRGQLEVNEREKIKRSVVMPYMHKISHQLKNVGGRYNVLMVFSTPNKLGGLSSRTNHSRNNKCCTIRHTTPYLTCASGVVYEIPLSCGRVYVGQMERCVNGRLREPNNPPQASPSATW